jgi:predicted dehydrogenase
VAGLNGRGVAHLDAFTVMADVRVAAIIDPDGRLFASRIKLVEEKGKNTPAALQDVRRVLEDKTIDAVSIATPNHWHALMTIWACQAGKDVYVEKPLSHNVHEGRIAVEAARRYGRIVQHGTQTRSNPRRAKTLAIIASGKLGKLLVSRGLCYKSRGEIGFAPVKQPPPDLDFNLWLGPAGEQSYHENLVHYNWHWFWDFGNGDIGNQGVHEMDVARWAIPGAKLPRSAISFGGRFGPKDQGEAANTQVAVFDYGETQLIFEVRGLPTESYHGQKVGNAYHCEAGTIYGADFYPTGRDKPEPLPDIEVEMGPGGEDHFFNFIAAVRSRKMADLNAEALEGHYSSALCHLANASYRLGEEVPFNPRTMAFGDDRSAHEALARMEEHLASDGFKLDGLKYRLGRKLVIDPEMERVVNDNQANALLTRPYRKPFIVPDQLA